MISVEALRILQQQSLTKLLRTAGVVMLGRRRSPRSRRIGLMRTLSYRGRYPNCPLFLPALTHLSTRKSWSKWSNRTLCCSLRRTRHTNHPEGSSSRRREKEEGKRGNFSLGKLWKVSALRRRRSQYAASFWMLGEKDSQPRGILCWNIPPPDWASWWDPPTSLVGWKIKITREITGFLCRNPSLLRWIYSRRSTRIFFWQKPREFCCNFRNAPKVKFNKLTVAFLYWFFPKWIFPHLGEWLRSSSAERPGVLAAWWTDYGAVLRPQIFPKNRGLSCPA